MYYLFSLIMVLVLAGCSFDIAKANQEYLKREALYSRSQLELQVPACETEIVVGKNTADLKKQLRVMSDLNYRVYRLLPEGQDLNNQYTVYAVIWRPRKGHSWAICKPGEIL